MAMFKGPTYGSAESHANKAKARLEDQKRRNQITSGQGGDDAAEDEKEPRVKVKGIGTGEKIKTKGPTKQKKYDSEGNLVEVEDDEKTEGSGS